MTAAAQQPAVRFAVTGSCRSTRVVLDALLARRLTVAGVLGLDRSLADGVSDYEPLAELARRSGVPAQTFREVNAVDVISALRRWRPDVVFVVGLSQLVAPRFMEVARVGCVGFHPTRLPLGRGRAPVAWMILDGVPGAATFFHLEERADTGAILEQEPFEVGPEHYAQDVMASMYGAMAVALERLLPRLARGDWTSTPQADHLATHYGVRRPPDGVVDWGDTAARIHTLVRATSRPHPGAYTFLGGHKIRIWRARLGRDVPFRGAVGRIVAVDERKGPLVQSGDGLLWLEEIEVPESARASVRVGAKLGICPQEVCADLQNRVAVLEQQLRRLQRLEPRGSSEGLPR